MKILTAILAFGLFLVITGCGQQGEKQQEAKEPAANVLELAASGIRFQGSETISSGWTTIRFSNKDPMLHFAIVVRLPEGVTAYDYSNDLGTKFQQGYNLMVGGKEEEAGKVFASLPAWADDLIFFGGAGFTSGMRTSEATMKLAPGNYVIECYIKSNGFFHSFSPVEDQLAMLHPLTVTDEPGDMAEPDANATLVIDEDGYRLVGGTLRPGQNTIRVEFQTQKKFPTFVGQDVHIVQLKNDGDLDAALGWMNWQDPAGELIPAPVTFVGGINELPAGSTGYITADLDPGHYAFIGEVPGADEKGLLLEFDVE